MIFVVTPYFPRGYVPRVLGFVCVQLCGRLRSGQLLAVELLMTLAAPLCASYHSSSVCCPLLGWSACICLQLCGRLRSGQLLAVELLMTPAAPL
jgi:hypothetical protein